LLIFISALAISFYYRRKAETSSEPVSWRDEGAVVMILLRLFGALMWLSVIVYLINPAWMRWSQLDLPIWLRWLGVVIGLICLPLLYWLFRSIGTNITQTVATREHHQLVTHGPYRWVRHPLYTVGMTLFVSMALIAANWFILLATLLSFVMLLVRLPKEEEMLIAKFGDEYREYMQRTGSLLPRIARS